MNVVRLARGDCLHVFAVNKLNWDSENEYYWCYTASTNSNYCHAYKTHEDSDGADLIHCILSFMDCSSRAVTCWRYAGEFERGDAVCQTESSNNQYCQTWRISQEEIKKCKDGERQISWPYTCEYQQCDDYSCW